MVNKHLHYSKETVNPTNIWLEARWEQYIHKDSTGERKTPTWTNQAKRSKDFRMISGTQFSKNVASLNSTSYTAMMTNFPTLNISHGVSCLTLISSTYMRTRPNNYTSYSKLQTRKDYKHNIWTREAYIYIVRWHFQEDNSSSTGKHTHTSKVQRASWHLRSRLQRAILTCTMPDLL